MTEREQMRALHYYMHRVSYYMSEAWLWHDSEPNAYQPNIRTDEMSKAVAMAREANHQAVRIWHGRNQ